MPGGAWNFGGSILTFLFPMILFVLVATTLFVLYTKPEVVPGHWVAQRPVSYTAVPSLPQASAPPPAEAESPPVAGESAAAAAESPAAAGESAPAAAESPAAAAQDAPAATEQAQPEQAQSAAAAANGATESTDGGTATGGAPGTGDGA
jgi:hypothetical protein